MVEIADAEQRKLNMRTSDKFLRATDLGDDPYGF